MKKRAIRSFSQGLVIFVIYFLTARFGLGIDAVGGFATLVWLPTGISLAAVLLGGLHLWPAISLGAFVANLLSGAPFFVACGIAIGNTLEAVIAASFLKRSGFYRSLERLQDVWGLLFYAVILSTLVSTTIGVLSLWAGKNITTAMIYPTWIAWWIGDMISNLVIAPLILIWSTRQHITYRGWQTVELIGVMILLFFVGYIVFIGISNESKMLLSVTYLVFPPLIWTSLRFSSRETITAIFLLSIFALVSTASGFGPFYRESVSSSLLYLQSFLATVAITALLLTAAVSERKYLEKKKDEFISVASHELKTPLTTLKAYAQLLNRRFAKVGNKNLSLYTKRINIQIDKLTKLVLELLDIGKIQEGKMTLKKTSFLLEELIREVVQDIEKATRHSIIIKGVKNTRVTADQDRIAQVLVNLLTNATKYSTSAQKIIIRILSTSEQITVSIQDFGIGIPIGEQHNIFKRFYRLDTSTTKEVSLGLGLYITKEIIERHNGKIWVESPSSDKKYPGSIFYFTLPLDH